MEGWAVWLEVPPGGTAVPTSFPFPRPSQWPLFAGRVFLASPSPAQPQVCIHGAQSCTHTHTQPSSGCILFQDKKSGDPRGGCQSPCSPGTQTH